MIKDVVWGLTWLAAFLAAIYGREFWAMLGGGGVC